MKWKFKKGDIVKIKNERYQWCYLYRIYDGIASVNMNGDSTDVIYIVEMLDLKLISVYDYDKFHWYRKRFLENELILVPKRKLQEIKVEAL